MLLEIHFIYSKQTFLSPYAVPALTKSYRFVCCLIAPSNQDDKVLILCVTRPLLTIFHSSFWFYKIGGRGETLHKVSAS